MAKSKGPTAILTPTLVLLRGVNVGGKHPVPMGALRTAFEALGCSSVATYIQSGNLVCLAPQTLDAETIAGTLTRQFGFPIPVVQRTGAELAACIDTNPLVSGGLPAEFLHAVFFAQVPEPGLLALLEAKRAGEERIIAQGSALMLYLPHGVGRSKLATACTAPSVRGTPTMRNWKTVLQLRAMLDACSGHLAQ